MAMEQLREAIPVERLPSQAPIEPLMPGPLDVPIESPQTAEIRRPPVVLVVTRQFGIERRGLVLDRVVPVLLAPQRHRLGTAPKAGTHRPDVNREPAPSAARTHVR
jgi:hypothetical protein